MRFSNYARRFMTNSGIQQLMDDLGSAQYLPDPTYMLGGGNPAHISAVQQCFQETLRDITDNTADFNRMVGDYDGPQGNEDFIEALAAFFTETYEWPISREHIAITNGSQSSFGTIFNCLAGEHDNGSFKKVLLPLTPEYIGYKDVSHGEHMLFEGLKPKIEKQHDGFFKYHIDFDQLQIDSRYGAVCVSRPTNPSGNVISDAELAKLAQQCEAADVPLVIDGAYGLPFPAMIFNNAKPVWNNNIVLCLSLSKLGLPGLRTGIVIANPALIQIIAAANAIHSLAPGRVGPTLATALLKNNKLKTLCEDTIQPFYKTRAQQAATYIRKTMADLPVYIHQPEGALFLWLWFEGLPISCAALYQQLKTQGVFVIAGHHFYPGITEDWPHKNECIRLSYAAEPNIVNTGINIIASTVRKLYSENPS